MKNLLTKPYAAGTGSNLIDIDVALDMGSTETRGIIITPEDFTETVKLDSNFSELYVDSELLVSKSDQIIDNLEIYIEPLTTKTFNPITVLKGNLLKSVTTQRILTTANSSKIDQEHTYVNIVSNLAVITLLWSMEENLRITDKVDLNVSVALPAEDLISSVRKETFIEKLAGEYKVTFNRLGAEFILNIKEDSVKVYSESNASITSEFVSNDELVGDTFALIDVGGRSTGFSIVNEGVLLENVFTTVGFGGQYMKDVVADEVCTLLNILRPDDSTVSKALESGMLKTGAHYIDISECINKAKEDLALRLFNEFMKALDIAGIQAQKLSYVYCSGRTFGVSKNKENVIVSDSLMKNIEHMFKKRSHYTEFRKVSSPDTVVEGVALLSVMDKQ